MFLLLIQKQSIKKPSKYPTLFQWHAAHPQAHAAHIVHSPRLSLPKPAPGKDFRFARCPGHNFLLPKQPIPMWKSSETLA
jgi:hypothetical protein